MAANDGAEGHRRVIGPENGGADFRDRTLQAACGNRHAVDVAEFPLIGTKAQRGVALDVLDRFEPFTRGQFDTRGRDIVLQIDELLGGSHGRLHVRHLEERAGGFLAPFGDVRQPGHGRGALEPDGIQRAASPFGSVFEHRLQGEDAVNAAHRCHALDVAGHEAQHVVTPYGPGSGMGREVDDGAVAAGAGDGVAAQRLFVTENAEGVQIDPGDASRRDAVAALGFDDGALVDDPDTQRASLFGQFTLRRGAGIDDRHHFTTGLVPVQRRAIGVIVADRQHQLVAGHDAETSNVGRHRTGDHVAGNVVVAVDQRALVGPRCQDDLPGAHAMQAGARLRATVHGGGGIPEMLGATLVKRDEVMIVVAIGRGSRQQFDVLSCR